VVRKKPFEEKLMHELLPVIASVCIGVPVAIKCKLNWLESAMVTAGLCAAFIYLGH
jgi:hypothetical protein